MKSNLQSFINQATKDPALIPIAIQAAYDAGRADEKETKRTLLQNNSIHKDCEMIAKKIEERGLDMKQVIRLDIPPTMQNVKDNIWRPVMRKMYGKESTKELEKSSGEIDKIHEVIMRELGKEWGIEWHDFPHDEKKQKEWEQAQMGISEIEYPTENNDPDKIPF